MVSGWIPTKIKRPWVPDWLFRIAAHWLPLAKLLCETPRCRCGEPATWWTAERGFDCDAHYREWLGGRA